LLLLLYLANLGVGGRVPEMKLFTFWDGEKYALGVQTKLGSLHVELAGNGHGLVSTDIMHIIEEGEPALALLKEWADGMNETNAAYWLDESKLEYGPCVTEPGKIICVGLNYRKHAEETNAAIPTSPILFNKFSNSLAGNSEAICIPSATHKLDYEAELAIVIGKRAKHVTKEKALHYVFGYCPANDLSARDLQLKTSQWLLGKSCDGFCPIGPYLTTADEVGDPNDLAISTIVNGEVRQSSNTSDMIFYCDEIISYISRHMTLEPGDIILTGTPEGVVLGYPPERQIYLKSGDIVTIEIEKLGALTNSFTVET
jgi:2-keto-4-pentenoate hydratase/2-oxohepta-3-ene-1,7-dioic acid hydratase in catechol pathway